MIPKFLRRRTWKNWLPIGVFRLLKDSVRVPRLYPKRFQILQSLLRGIQLRQKPRSSFLEPSSVISFFAEKTTDPSRCGPTTTKLLETQKKHGNWRRHLKFWKWCDLPRYFVPNISGISGHLTVRIFWCNNNSNNNNDNNNNDNNNMMHASHFQHGICWDDSVGFPWNHWGYIYIINLHKIAKTNSSPLKMDTWKRPIFRLLVLGRVSQSHSTQELEQFCSVFLRFFVSQDAKWCSYLWDL